MSITAWSDWASTIPQDQLQILASVLKEKLPTPEITTPPAPAAVEEATDKIPIVCTPAQELYVQHCPPFSDVFNLFPVYQQLSFQDHGNLLLKGPKGNGKSLSIRAFAATFKIPLVVIECSENTKDLQLIGRYVLAGGETQFVLTGIPKAIKTANEVGRCILLFEEFNALTPQSQKLLNGVLQERAIEVDALGRTYRLKPGCSVWFTGTMNPSVYGGTYDLNEDLKSRMGEIETDYPPTEYEKQIVRANLGECTSDMDALVDLVLRFAKESRQQAMGYQMSTRDVVRSLMTIRTSGLKTALQMIICKYEGEDKKTAIARLNSIFKGASVETTWTGKP